MKNLKNDIKLKDCMVEAIENISDFITQTTGAKPEQEEIAAALSKYFVLKEILEFIQMERQEKKDQEI